MLFAQVGMDSGIVTGIPYGIAASTSSGTAIFGCLCGAAGLLLSFARGPIRRLGDYAGAAAVFWLAAYGAWWWGVERMPTEPPYFAAAVAGAALGVAAMARLARRA